MPRVGGRVSELAGRSHDQLDTFQTIVFALFAMAATVGIPAWIHSTVRKLVSSQNRRHQSSSQMMSRLRSAFSSGGGIGGGSGTFGGGGNLTWAAAAAALCSFSALVLWRLVRLRSAREGQGVAATVLITQDGGMAPQSGGGSERPSGGNRNGGGAEGPKHSKVPRPLMLSSNKVAGRKGADCHSCAKAEDAIRNDKRTTTADKEEAEAEAASAGEKRTRQTKCKECMKNLHLQREVNESLRDAESRDQYIKTQKKVKPPP